MTLDFLDRFTVGERILLSAGGLLVLDLLFLPWHGFPERVVAGQGVVSTVHRAAVQSPHPFWGVLALLVTVALITQVLMTRTTAVDLADVPVPWSQVHLVGGASVAAALLLKVLIEPGSLAVGSWLGLVLGLGVAYAGYTIDREAAAGG